MSEQKQVNSDLTWHWVYTSLMLALLLAYNVFCHFTELEIQSIVTEDSRILIRSILYGLAIILFPVVTLLRHILLRLNQTMPGDKSAKSRYLFTIITTLTLISAVGLFGLAMFVLGDGYNTLYIFSMLGILGIFLHKPNQQEYQYIIDALRNN
jgi:heme/copper-type cytochrome/quinol oxidase subunit 2